LIAVFDYGSGNLRSVERAFEQSGHDVIVTSNDSECMAADGIVLPGVGAFGACMDQLRAIGGDLVMRKAIAAGKKVFGICVGEQILFSQGTEKGIHEGLGIFQGSVDSLIAPVLPHIGWNTVAVGAGSQLFAGVENQRFYFVHSYAVGADIAKTLDGAIVSTTTYGDSFIAAIERENVVATQFHPEKSGRAGLQIIRNWADHL
jgi:glutamine amidotransferase